MLSILGPLLTFALAATLTPGPNNIMITASGANFGYVRSIPHMLGITFGFAAMVMALGLGLGQLFKLIPALHTGLQLVGSAYLVYLAWRIATAGRAGKADGAGRPLTFLEASLFQWVNPKAWMLSIGALTAFTSGGGNYLAETAFIAGVFILVTYPSVTAWCLFGTAIGSLLRSDRVLRIFNWTMGGLVAASILLLYI